MNAEKPEFFTAEEAKAKVDKKVVTTIDFSGVPKGTEGKVLEPYEGDYTSKGDEVRSLPIQWELPGRQGKALVDWFTKDEYGKWLKEC